MPWLLLDVVLVLVALVVLAVCGLGLWRGVKQLSREVGRAGADLGAASEALAAVQPAGPAAPVVPAPAPAGRRARR